MSKTEKALQVDEAIKPKLIPIFIGTELQKIVEILDPIVKYDFPTHTLAIMSPELFGKMVYDYEVSQFSEDQRKQIQSVQADDKRKEQAKDVALLIQTFQLKQFKPYELKVAYQKRGRKLSNKQIREIIDFLVICGFMVIVDTELPFHEARFRVTVTEADKVKQLQLKNSAIKFKIAQLNLEIEANEKQIIDLSPKKVIPEGKTRRLDKIKDKELIADLNTVAAKRKKKAADESIVDTGNPIT